MMETNKEQYSEYELREIFSHCKDESYFDSAFWMVFLIFMVCSCTDGWDIGDKNKDSQD